MNELGPATAPLAGDRPIAITVLALGGQGGGVLCDWIVELAENQGWHAQSTSVPGVAQRTGATIYYIEMMKPKDEREPILSLMPTPGDVDVVIAAEWMEAGRSMMRGLVTPEKTLLIASTHRALAVVEKQRPGDGIAEPTTVTEAAGVAARRTIAFDMQRLAEQNGSFISASLFGALAGAQAMPFAKEAFVAVIKAGGRNAEPSLKTFEAAYRRAGAGGIEPVSRQAPKKLPAPPESAGHPRLDRLLARLRGEFPPAAQAMLYAGVRKLTSYQDPAYADDYLDRVARFLAADRTHAGDLRDFALTREAAKHVANAMAYDDVIRVADLKTRAGRMERVRREQNVDNDHIVYTTEFMHPRAEEMIGLLPRGLGLWFERNRWAFDGVDRMVNRARRVRTGTIGAFLSLYLIAGLRPWRRRTLRHMREREHMERWLEVALAQVDRDYDLAVEVLKARRLVKGYSDTHARGRSKFDRVLGTVSSLSGRADAAQWLHRLHEAALQDEEGTALDGALKTVSSL